MRREKYRPGKADRKGKGQGTMGDFLVRLILALTIVLLTFALASPSNAQSRSYSSPVSMPDVLGIQDFPDCPLVSKNI